MDIPSLHTVIHIPAVAFLFRLGASDECPRAHFRPAGDEDAEEAEGGLLDAGPFAHCLCDDNCYVFSDQVKNIGSSHYGI